MIRMSVRDVMEATGATLVAGDPSVVFEGVEIDSRAVRDGGAFVAFVCERVDGNQYAATALEAGASLVVLTAEPTEELLTAVSCGQSAVLRAKDDDGEAFMLALAGAWRARNPQWVVAGVTGSVGKTTTKDMLAAAVGATRRVHATKGNFNNLLGVPLTLMRAPADAEVLVVEMGMNHAGELRRIAACARPDVAVITNVGTSHIGNLGSREGIARAKAEVVSGMRGTDDVPATLVLTASDDYTGFIEREFAAPAGVRVLRVGEGAASNLHAQDVSLDYDGLPTCTLVFEDGALLTGALSLPGKAMVADALSAMGVCEALGLDREASFAALCSLASTHMRMEVRQQPGTPRVIDDSYNASPSSMAAALDVLCSMRCDGRRVAVLGEIGELGDEADRLHGLVGAYAAAKPLDLLVLVGGEGARVMEDAARTMGLSEDRIERFDTAQKAASVMKDALAPSDLVLVKASRAVGLDLFAREVLGS